MTERMVWKEIQEKYPDKWVIMADVDLDGSTIISGIIVEVCNDDEIDSHYCKLIKSGKNYMKERTTDMGTPHLNKKGNHNHKTSSTPPLYRNNPGNYLL